MKQQTSRQKVEKGTSRPAESGFDFLTKLLTLVSQTVALAGIIGFVLTVIIQSLIFQTWGLVFLQIATPSDIIVSGFLIGVTCLGPILGAVVGWFWGAPIVNYIESKWIGTVIIAIGLIGYGVLMWFSRSAGPLWVTSSFLSFFLTAIASAGRNIRLSRWDKISGLTFLMLIILFPLILSSRVTGPFFANEPKFSLAPAPPACASPMPLWAGERAIVVRCFGFAGGVRVLLNPESYQIVPMIGVSTAEQQLRFEAELAQEMANPSLTLPLDAKTPIAPSPRPESPRER